MDMLVKLYDLHNSGDAFERLTRAGIIMRRALPPEKHKVTAWVRKTFSEAWASEAEIAFSRQQSRPRNRDCLRNVAAHLP
jgi:hypothetical protein